MGLDVLYVMLRRRLRQGRNSSPHPTRGVVYFQGYFFRKPEIVANRDLPANRIELRLLQGVSTMELNLAALENLAKREASICYRLLRYLNSAAFGLRSEMHSVRHALSILG